MTTERLEERGRAPAVLLAARGSVETRRRLDAEVRSGRRSEWDVEAPAA
jgi:hypothetical protein